MQPTPKPLITFRGVLKYVTLVAWVGNLLSQIYALIYLNPLDHYIKRVLKARHYARYVDDFILIGITRAEALSHRAAIVEFLVDRLGLELSKSTIAPVRRGANFVGYRTWASRRFVRRHALYTYRRALAVSLG